MVDKRFKYDRDGIDLTVPILKDINEIQRKWSINDIALKMTLLGNYFSTYFMPIHMDLLFSSIENLVFTTPAKCKTAYSNIRVEDSYIGDDLSIILDEEPLSQYVIGDINNASIKFDDANAFGYFVKNPAGNGTDVNDNPSLYCSTGAVINLPIRVISERVPIPVITHVIVDDKKVFIKKGVTRVVKLDILAESTEYQKKDIYKKYTYIDANNEEVTEYRKVGTLNSTGEIIYNNIIEDDITYIVSPDIYVKTSEGYEKFDNKPDKRVFTLSIPVNFYINDINENDESEYYELSLFIKRIGSYNLQIVAYDEYGRTAISDRFPIKVVNPDYNHINIYQMKRIKNADEMKIHIFDTQLALNGTPGHTPDQTYNIDITPGYIYRRNDNRIKMFYPDYVCNYISCCNIIDPDIEHVYICVNWTGDENDVYTEVNINDFINTKSTNEEIIRGNIKAAGWDWTYREFEWVSNNNPNDPNDPADVVDGRKVRLLILFSLTSNPVTKCAIRHTNDPKICKLTYYNDSTDKGGYLYVKAPEIYKVNKGDTTYRVTYRVPLFFDEKRFIPAFWTLNPSIKPSSKKEDAIYVAVPTNRNTYYTDNTWVITNESTGQKGIIKGLVSPIFWANNNRSNKNPRGIYSITLNTKYSDAKDAKIETTTFKHAFKIE